MKPLRLPRRAGGHLAVLLMALAVGQIAAAAEVVVLVTPRCALDKGADLSGVECPALDIKGLKIAAGTKVADVTPAGETYIIELGPTNVATENFTTRVFLDTSPNVATVVTYPRARLLQPYKVWYAKDASARPQPLGEGFQFRMQTPLEYVSPERAKILNKKPAELVQEGMLELCGTLAAEIENALAPKIVLGRSDRLNFATIQKRYGTPAESEVYQRMDRPRFAPGKVTYENNGEVTVEVPVHNRLPARVTGYLRREETKQETFARMQIGGAIALNKPECQQQFDLKPGEKTSIKFTVLAPLVMRGLPEQSYFEVRMLKLHSP